MTTLTATTTAGAVVRAGARSINIPVDAFNSDLRKHSLEVLEHFDCHPEVRHRVLVWHRRARKTSLAINLLLRDAVESQDKTFAHILPTFRQAKQVLWLDPMMLKRYMPDEILRKPFNQTELVAEFNSGSVLYIGGADTPDRWRGMGCYGWVLDEYATMANGKMLYEEIIYPIIRENGGWVLFCYTPKGRNLGWEYYKKAKDRPNWKSWLLPVTKSDILDKEQIDEAHKVMPEHLFRQELMCEFLVGGGGVIRRVDEAVSGSLEEPIPGQRYVLGVDLGRKMDWTVLVVIRRDTRQVVAFDRFQKIDWSFQKEKIARMALKYNNTLTVIDSTGIGDTIENDLQRLGMCIRGYQFTQKSKRQLIEKLILAVEDRHITFPKIDILIDELKDFDIDLQGKYSAPSGMHDDCVIALALAIEGLGAEVYGATQAKSAYRPYNERYGSG